MLLCVPYAFNIRGEYQGSRTCTDVRNTLCNLIDDEFVKTGSADLLKKVIRIAAADPDYIAAMSVPTFLLLAAASLI